MKFRSAVSISVVFCMSANTLSYSSVTLGTVDLHKPFLGLMQFNITKLYVLCILSCQVLMT